MRRLLDFGRGLNEYDRSALKSCVDVIHCLLNGEPVDLQPMCTEILRWVDHTRDITERYYIKPVVEIACTRLQLAFEGESIDMQPVYDKLQEVIEELPNINQSDRLFYKYVANISCTAVECVFRRPFSLQPMRHKLHELIDGHPESPEVGRPFLKRMADVLCTCLECLFRRPVDLHPAWQSFHEWIVFPWGTTSRHLCYQMCDSC